MSVGKRGGWRKGVESSQEGTPAGASHSWPGLSEEAQMIQILSKAWELKEGKRVGLGSHLVSANVAISTMRYALFISTDWLDWHHQLGKCDSRLPWTACEAKENSLLGSILFDGLIQMIYAAACTWFTKSNSSGLSLGLYFCWQNF